MFEAIANVLKIPDLRNRILFTLAMLAVYRLGIFIPAPGVDRVALGEFFASNQGTLLGMYDMFSGGALEQFSVFVLGIMPYISASIIMQLMGVVLPQVERMKNEGQQGRNRINQITRYLTIGIAIVQAMAIAITLESTRTSSGTDVVIAGGWAFRAMTIITMTAGSCFVMWLGEQITDRGVGQGSSLIITAGIIARLPTGALNTIQKLRIGEINLLQLVLLLGLMLLVILGIVIVERGQRRIPIQYAKRVVGRRMMGGQSTHLPLKVNAGGVIPVIFASSLLAFPLTMLNIPFIANNKWLSGILTSIRSGEPLYIILFITLIIFFSFFYVSIIFNPNEAADNMRKYGGFIPGIRPGKNTADYMNKILTRITVVGGLYLAILSLIPELMIGGIKLQHLPPAALGNWIDSNFPRWLLDGLGVTFVFGGTSLLIVVGVAMDTVNQVEAQLIMRHYEGFTPRAGRIRGRRSGA